MKNKRLLVCGKTGSGKSSLCNFIFNVEGYFKVGHSLKAETINPQRELLKLINEQFDVEIVDLPGLQDNRSIGLDEYATNVIEITKGFNVILYVIDISQARFSNDDFTNLKMILRMTEEAFDTQVYIVFNQIDKLD